MNINGFFNDVNFSKTRYAVVALAAAFVWYWLYKAVEPASVYVTFDLLGISAGSKAGAAVQFFIYDTLKIMLLLLAMVYAIGWIRASFNVEKVRDFLRGKGSAAGYFFGSAFGAVTPFCSCSSIPLFIGFTSARIPLGVTMAFLITSPMINEVAIVLLWGLLGWKFTVAYVATGIVAGMAGGFIIDRIKAERWLKDFIRGSGRPLTAAGSPEVTPRDRHNFAASETKEIFGRVWKWIVIGVGLGAVLHGYVPGEFIEKYLGAGQWWSVPAAVLAGLPLYANVAGIIPVMESLLLKGLPVGTTLALCMSAVTVSLPEILMLKQVMKWRLLALFIGIMTALFILVGWLYNFIFANPF